jgi:hypothetical protein
VPGDNENKHDLLANIRRERAALDDLLAPLDEAAMLAVARDDGWTPKDILAHLTTWEQRLLRWIERWRNTGDPGRPEIGVTWDGFDELNDRDFREAKEKTLADVRDEAGASYEAVLRTLDDMSDEDLATRPEAQDGPSWSWIIGANTYRHYQPHREEMEAWEKRNE